MRSRAGACLKAKLYCPIPLLVPQRLPTVCTGKSLRATISILVSQYRVGNSICLPVPAGCFWCKSLSITN